MGSRHQRSTVKKIYELSLEYLLLLISNAIKGPNYYVSLCYRQLAPQCSSSRRNQPINCCQNDGLLASIHIHYRKLDFVQKQRSLLEFFLKESMTFVVIDIHCNAQQAQIREQMRLGHNYNIKNQFWAGLVLHEKKVWGDYEQLQCKFLLKR